MSVRVSPPSPRPIPPRASLPPKIRSKSKPLDRAWQQGQCVADLDPIIVHNPHALPTTEDPQEIKRAFLRRARNRFLAIFGIGALCIAGVFYTFGTWIFPGMERSGRQQIYGESHAVILEARVGHHDEGTPTLFIAFPRSGRLYLVEIAGGDPQQTHAYPLGWYAGKEEEMMLSLSVRDVNRDGKVDLVVTTGKSESGMILYNNGKTFQLVEPTQTPPQAEPEQQASLSGVSKIGGNSDDTDYHCLHHL